jgi:hypothetical protein
VKHQVCLPNLLNLVVLVSLVSCQTVATPFSTAIPSATTIAQPTLIPTATPKPTATPLPTSTPVPPCGTVALPQAAAPPADTSIKFAKFEPPENQVYFGFTFRIRDEVIANWGDVRSFQERICDSVKFELSGKTPTFIAVYSGLRSPFSAALEDIVEIRNSLGPSVIPVVKWQVGWGPNTKSIAAGQLDEYIAQYARDVKQYGKPLFIQLFCSGFNGNWDNGCSPKANPDLTSGDFVNAWHRFVDIFRQEGVNNVAWIWEPAVPPPPSVGDWGWDDWWAYYPGDDYVDWVGALQSGWGKPNWLDPLQEFGIVHHKPVLVEFAIRHSSSNLTHQQWINWLTAMFDYFESHPQIKAISYINDGFPNPNPISTDPVFLYDGKVNYIPNVNDMDQRLMAGGDDIRALFADRVADSRYVSVLAVGP